MRAVGPRGEVVQVGGWGQLLGDEGSGYRIGLDGLRAVMRASDGREPRTSLSAAVLDAAGAAEPRDLVGWAARATKGEVAALSVLVAREARNGDPVAARIVHGRSAPSARIWRPRSSAHLGGGSVPRSLSWAVSCARGACCARP